MGTANGDSLAQVDVVPSRRGAVRTRRGGRFLDRVASGNLAAVVDDPLGSAISSSSIIVTPRSTRVVAQLGFGCGPVDNFGPLEIG